MFDFKTPNLIDIEIDSSINGKVYVLGCLYIPALAKNFKVSSIPMNISNFEKAYQTGPLARLEAEGAITLRPIVSNPSVIISKDIIDDSNLVSNPVVDKNPFSDDSTTSSLVIEENKDPNPFGYEVSDSIPSTVDNSEPPKKLTVVSKKTSKAKN